MCSKFESNFGTQVQPSFTYTVILHGQSILESFPESSHITGLWHPDSWISSPIPWTRVKKITQLQMVLSSKTARGGKYPGLLIEWIFRWIEYRQIQILNQFLNWTFAKKKIIEKSFELKFSVKWINELYIEFILSIFD